MDAAVRQEDRAGRGRRTYLSSDIHLTRSHGACSHALAPQPPTLHAGGRGQPTRVDHQLTNPSKPAWLQPIRSGLLLWK